MKNNTEDAVKIIDDMLSWKYMSYDKTMNQLKKLKPLISNKEAVEIIDKWLNCTAFSIAYQAEKLLKIKEFITNVDKQEHKDGDIELD